MILNSNGNIVMNNKTYDFVSAKKNTDGTYSITAKYWSDHGVAYINQGWNYHMS